MKKDIYLTILIVVTAVCMLFGTLYHTGILRKSARVVYGTSEMKHERIDVEDLLDPDEPETETTDIEKNETAGVTDKITEIAANLDLGDLKIRQGSTFGVQYEGDDRFEPEVEIENGKLTIEQENRDLNLTWGNIKCEVTVTIPEETDLKSVDIDLNLGDVELASLTVSAGTIHNSLGDIDVENCRLGTMNIESDLGDVDVIECTFRELTVDQNMGDVDVTTRQDMSAASIELETSLGEVKINGKGQGTEFRTDGDGGVLLAVENDMGDIKLDY